MIGLRQRAGVSRYFPVSEKGNGSARDKPLMSNILNSSLTLYFVPILVIPHLLMISEECIFYGRNYKSKLLSKITMTYQYQFSSIDTAFIFKVYKY